MYVITAKYGSEHLLNRKQSLSVNTAPSANRSIVRIFLLLRTVHSYQGVHLPEAGLKETAYKHHSNLRAISYKGSYCSKYGNSISVIIRYRIR